MHYKKEIHDYGLYKWTKFTTQLVYHLSKFHICHEKGCNDDVVSRAGYFNDLVKKKWGQKGDLEERKARVILHLPIQLA